MLSCRTEVLAGGAIYQVVDDVFFSSLLGSTAGSDGQAVAFASYPLVPLMVRTISLFFDTCIHMT